MRHHQAHSRPSCNGTAQAEHAFSPQQAEVRSIGVMSWHDVYPHVTECPGAIASGAARSSMHPSQAKIQGDQLML
jgi:hypothetical protein